MAPPHFTFNHVRFSRTGDFMIFQLAIILLIAAFFDAVVYESGIGGIAGSITAVMFWVFLAIAAALLLLRLFRGPSTQS
jgi:hypothetical protein